MLFLGLWRLRGHCAVAQNAISASLEIARSLCGHCAVPQKSISGPLEIARSLCGVSECSKYPFLAFGDCSVIARKLKMPFLGI